MPDNSQMAMLNQLIEAVNQGDLDLASSLLLDEFYGYRPQAGELTQPEAFRQLAPAVRAACPDLRVTLEDIAAEGDELRGRMTMAGTFTGSLWGVPGNGAAVTLTGTAIARIKDGRLAMRWEGLAFPDALRAMGVLPYPKDAHLKPKHPPQVPEIILRLAWNGMRLAEKPCSHLDQIRVTQPGTHVCQACVDSGDEWPMLRMCVVCGYVGCCDLSVNKHMLKHSQATGHALVRSIQPGEAWLWCYADTAFLSSRHLPG
jgi:predicted ester cyclase